MSRFDVRTELILGGRWVDISPDVYQRDDIEITRGRSDEASSVDPGKCKLTLNNRQGRYSPRNPTSPHYGLLGRNTPLRVWVGKPTVGEAAATDQTGTDHVAPSVSPRAPDSLLVCAWIAAFDTVTTGDYTVPASMTADEETDRTNSTMVSATEAVTEPGETGTRTAVLSQSSTTHTTAAAAVPGESGPPVIEEFRFDVADSDDITLTTSVDTQVGWWLLGIHAWTFDSRDDMNPQPGGAAGEWLPVADSETANTRVPRVRVWARRVNVAGPQEVLFRADPNDRGGYQNNARLYLLSNVAFHSPRFAGEVSAWPPRWDASDTDVYVPLEAAGILRRLGQGAAPIRSAVYRETTAPSKPDPTWRDPVAYWPCEDSEGATSIASALSNGTPMIITAGPDLAAFEDFASSEPLPLMKNGALTGQVPDYPVTGETQVRWLQAVPGGGTTDGAPIMVVRAGGDARRWDVVYHSGGNLSVRVAAPNGSQIHDSGLFAFNVDGRPLRASLEITQQGTDVQYRFTTLQAGTDGESFSDTVTGVTFGRLRQVTAAEDRNLGDTAVGHVAVYNQVTSIFDLGDALNAWRDETAGRRIQRLCQEEGITFFSTGDLDDTVVMGPQQADNLLDLLDGAAVADGGILHETRSVLGLTYRTRFSLYNQAVAT